MVGNGCSCVKCHNCDWCTETRLNAQEDIRGPLSELQLEVMTDIQDQILDYRYIDLQQVNYICIPKFWLTKYILYILFYFHDYWK